MFNTLKMSFKIDVTYTINSFIYSLKHTPLLKSIFTKNLYKSVVAKKVISIIALILSLFKMIFSKTLYVGFIYWILSMLYKKVDSNIFIHTFVFLTILGLFINANILAIGKKKYFSVILMNIDAKKYALSHFILDMFMNLLFNFLSLTIILVGLFNLNIIYPLLLSGLVVTLKTVGEAFNIYFYKKTRTIFISRTSLYFFIVITSLLLAIGFPFINIVLNYNDILLLFIISIVLGLFSLIYIFRIKDYKLMYKKINTEKAVMSSTNADSYNKQATVEIRKKDYLVDQKKIDGKKGYDYFNTIFFLRHRVILYNSANIFSYVLLAIIAVGAFYLLKTPVDSKLVYNTLNDYFAWSILIMYFVNRGAIITQAMFFNCDRSMLTFNFYRDSKVILNVFKQRLKTVIKVNLRPALVLGIGIPLLLIIATETFNINYISIFLSVIFLSIFFSVHYLVIYYLLQPYSVNMEVKSIAFSVVSFITYFGSYLCKDINLAYPLFSLLIIAATIIYIVVALIVVNKKAPSTFKLK